MELISTWPTKGFVYGFKSHPVKPDAEHPRLAVRVISQFGEESTKVMRVGVSQ